MKGTDHFKEVIQRYLNDKAKKSLLYMKTLKKPNKNIDDCINYIIQTVQKSGRSGFTDDEIYGMAMHYYDEDDLKVEGSDKNVTVVVNQFTEAEREALKQEARDQVVREEMDKLRGKDKKKSYVEPKADEQPKDGTLF